METLPEYIEGIPTAKKGSSERFELIMSYHKSLWKKLQKEGKSNSIKNEFLDVDIFIVEKESDKKTAREALHNWKSTYAVKHLDTVIKKQDLQRVIRCLRRARKASKGETVTKT